MASLQSRLSSLITAIGADIKALQARTPTILGTASSLSNTSEPTKAVEWYYTPSGQLVAKFVAVSPIESLTVIDRQELRLRLHNRLGTLTQDRLILDSNGNSDLLPPVVTALPTTGPGVGSALVDGQECYYVADSTAGVVWHLKYDATSTKWRFVGGAPLFKTVDTSESTASSTYAALATAGPAIAIPFAGDYIVEIGHGGVNAGSQTIMSYDVGATAAVDADFVISPGGGGNITHVSRSRTKTLAAGITLTSKYRVTSGTGSFRERWMKVTPVKVS